MVYHRILNILLCAITYCCYIRECLFPQEINTKRLGGVSKKSCYFQFQMERRKEQGRRRERKGGGRKGEENGADHTGL